MPALSLLAACLMLLAGCGGTRGMTLPYPDRRTPIALTAKEQDRLRLGMRIYLESVEGVLEGAQRSSMAQVARSAERSGMGMVEDIAFSDAMRLPPEFIFMSMETHQKFDALSREAAAGSLTKKDALSRLSAILASCTACHATYRLSR